jgi:hypothetical protein
MPMYEFTDMTVTLTVAVDGHLFEFERDRLSVRGARYHGADPGQPRDGGFEGSLREQAEVGMHDVTSRMAEFLARAYPLHNDP